MRMPEITSPAGSVTVPLNALQSTCVKGIPASQNIATNPIETQAIRSTGVLLNRPSFISQCIAPNKRVPERLHKIPRHAAARCAHRNHNPDIQVVTFGNTSPLFRLRAGSRIGVCRVGLSIVVVCAKFGRAQGHLPVSAIRG